jgi:hypothetical protein
MCCGHFEYVVMHVSLIFVHIIFEHVIKDVFDEILWYIRDILIVKFSKSLKEHEDVWLVLEKVERI